MRKATRHCSQTNIKLEHEILKSADKFQNVQTPVSKFNASSSPNNILKNSELSQKFLQLFGAKPSFANSSLMKENLPTSEASQFNSMKPTVLNSKVRTPFRNGFLNESKQS
jgi:hypothetical protein